MKRLLPRAVALEGLSRLVPDSKLALQLLEYWLRRRQQEGGPLLARLWFEQPWKVRRVVAAPAAAAVRLSSVAADGDAAGTELQGKFVRPQPRPLQYKMPDSLNLMC
jgi:hypothetical protein